MMVIKAQNYFLKAGNDGFAKTLMAQEMVLLVVLLVVLY